MWWTPIAFAADHYVGLPPNDQPTLAAALAAAAPGDRIVLGPDVHEAPSSPIDIDLRIMGVGPATILRGTVGEAVRVVGATLILRDLRVETTDERALEVSGGGAAYLERVELHGGSRGTVNLSTGTLELRGVQVTGGSTVDTSGGVHPHGRGHDPHRRGARGLRLHIRPPWRGARVAR
jgi:hypothetical protein